VTWYSRIVTINSAATMRAGKRKIAETLFLTLCIVRSRFASH
jgi:hypothetical protein